MKKILHISYISCFILASNISTANTDATQNGTSTQQLDLIVVEHDGNTPLPKKKLQKLNATQTTNTAAASQPAAPATAAAQPAAPATIFTSAAAAPPTKDPVLAQSQAKNLPRLHQLTPK